MLNNKHQSQINNYININHNYKVYYKNKLDNPNIVQQSPPSCQFDFNVNILQKVTVMRSNKYQNLERIKSHIRRKAV